MKTSPLEIARDEFESPSPSVLQASCSNFGPALRTMVSEARVIKIKALAGEHRATTTRRRVRRGASTPLLPADGARLRFDALHDPGFVRHIDEAILDHAGANPLGSYALPPARGGLS